MFMDCNQCVCSLCCRYARDITHREKIRNGEVTCCDYYPRPDNSLEKAIKAVSEMDISSGVSQSVYVIEECSELIKELMKNSVEKALKKIFSPKPAMFSLPHLFCSPNTGCRVIM